MAEDTSQEKKQPLWRKWWFWAIVVVLLVLGMIESQGSSSQTPATTTSSTTSVTGPSRSVAASSPSSSPSETDQDPVAVLDSIAQTAGMQATDTVSFQPDNEYSKNGPYKRAEYRLSAFQGSAGIHATLNGVPVDVVTYHQLSSHFVRIYATGDESVVLPIYSAAARVFDSSLSDDDIQAAISKYQSSEVKDSRDMLSTLLENDKIRSDYIIGSGSDCEIFIDANM